MMDMVPILTDAQHKLQDDEGGNGASTYLQAHHQRSSRGLHCDWTVNLIGSMPNWLHSFSPSSLSSLTTTIHLSVAFEMHIIPICRPCSGLVLLPQSRSLKQQSYQKYWCPAGWSIYPSSRGTEFCFWCRPFWRINHNNNKNNSCMAITRCCCMCLLRRLKGMSRRRRRRSISRRNRMRWWIDNLVLRDMFHVHFRLINKQGKESSFCSPDNRAATRMHLQPHSYRLHSVRYQICATYCSWQRISRTDSGNTQRIHRVIWFCLGRPATAVSGWTLWNSIEYDIVLYIDRSITSSPDLGPAALSGFVNGRNSPVN